MGWCVCVFPDWRLVCLDIRTPAIKFRESLGFRMKIRSNRPAENLVDSRIGDFGLEEDYLFARNENSRGMDSDVIICPDFLRVEE
ncbi:hypothetical protein CDAR_280501 [Caerostris darwini]|uniref:Uncharacterized protein n=1 Tax=Caerostris darwini TaxID=1538125 RepID=A0AAV4MI29_9ARAC|nr:hypothetical protein CDAR_280501 [Caerostris darwini]